jgi:hypothetical protein
MSGTDYATAYLCTITTLSSSKISCAWWGMLVELIRHRDKAPSSPESTCMMSSAYG